MKQVWVKRDGGGKIIEAVSRDNPTRDDLMPLDVADDATLQSLLWVDPLPALAEHRFNKEVGGVGYLANTIQTDRETRANWLGVLIQAQLNPSFTVDWKTQDGEFVTYDAKQAVGAATAVSAWVQKCFAIEAEVIAAIAGGSCDNDAQAAIAMFDNLML